MKYIESASFDPAWNLALEQYLFDAMDRRESYFYLWQNDKTIVIGRNQNAVQEINRDYVREHGIHVVRRLSGGGAVYHDLGNLNFTFITDAADSGRIDLRSFCEIIAAALQSIGVPAEVSGRNDLTVHGKKFSGNAQYVREHRVMHHGTILFDSDLSVVEKALNPPPEKIASKGIRSVASRVTNLKPYLPGVSLAQLKDALLAHMNSRWPLTPLALSEAEKKAVADICADRYARWEWNYGASPEYTEQVRRRFEGCGMVEAFLTVEGGLIRRLSFFGDFFSTDDPALLAEKLLDCPREEGAILERLENTDVSRFIHGLHAKELALLLAP